MRTNAGIDYGRGLTNLDPDTGIRYGIIRAHHLASWFFDELEPCYSYGCPHCGEELAPDFDDDACPACEATIEYGEHCGDEPTCHVLDTGTIKGRLDNDGDLWIFKSPWVTRGTFCSPCAPGAVSISEPCEDGPLAYCLSADWFDDENPMPYKATRRFKTKTKETP